MKNLEQKPLLRTLCAFGLALVFLAWLVYAMVIWDGRIAWGGQSLWPRSGRLPILPRFQEGGFGYEMEKLFRTRDNAYGLRAYLFLLPLPLLAFTLTALLPESLGKLFPRAKRLRFVYRILAALLLCFGLLCTLVSCTPWLDKVLSSGLRRLLRVWHMDLIPVCLAAAALGWLLPCLALRLGNRKTLGKDLGDGARKLLLSLLAGVLAVVWSALLMAVTRHFDRRAVIYVEDFCRMNAKSDLAFFVSVVMAPLLEEIVFRGLMQRALRKVLPAWPAILLSALFFGLWHRNTGQLIYTFFFGLLMGWLYEGSGKLRYPMLCHSWNNLLVTLCFPVKAHVLFGQLHILPKLGQFLLGLPLLPAVLLLAPVLAAAVWLLLRLGRGGKREKTL